MSSSSTTSSFSSSVKRQFVVRFVTTDGIVLDSNDYGRAFDNFMKQPQQQQQQQQRDTALGICAFYERELFIVDRTPSDDCSRLNVKDVVNLIKFTLKHLPDSGRLDDILIYLPKMTHQMMKEAVVQKTLRDVDDRIQILLV